MAGVRREDGRFAVVPSSAANDSLVVTASTSDPKGKVLVDGRPVRSGRPTTVTGLAPGDEVSVIIDDARGHSAQSWIYLPSTFPQLSTKGTLDEGKKHVFLTLSNFVTATPYETVVDRNAVPSWFEQGNGSDLKPVHLGKTRYSLARHDGGGGSRIDELDRRFHTIRSHQLNGVPASTDFHDSELLPDGRSLLLGYDGDHVRGHGYLDAVIQIVRRDGAADFTWNSKDHVDPAEAYVDGGTGDYAHINSLQYLPKSGDILASFRNLSQVMLIAGPDDSGHAAGTSSGGWAASRTTSPSLDDPDGGNCAQHMARILPNGHLMLFDNGSRADPTGPIGEQSGEHVPRPRAPGRGADRPAPDPDHRVPAEHQRPGSSASQAGAGASCRTTDTPRLPAASSGWLTAGPSSAGPWPTRPTAPPAGAGGEPGLAQRREGALEALRQRLVQLPRRHRPLTRRRPPEGHRLLAPRRRGLQEGRQGAAALPVHRHRGSSLDACRGTVANGHRLPTSHAGPFTVTVTARDGDGNRKRHTVTYRVRK